MNMNAQAFTNPAVPRIHGGPDALGAARFDFSTNSNACGPCPATLLAVQQADATRYPDASYQALRRQLGDFHGVDAARVVLAGSASEFIFRITGWAALRSGGQARVFVPARAYGDYAQAAQAWSLALCDEPDAAELAWACEPSSPQGAAHAQWPAWCLALKAQTCMTTPTLVLDCAYAPLRLRGQPSLSADQLARVWQLFTPNKALGLTGVRAAYAIAPLASEVAVAALEAMCASWPVGAHGVALLDGWVQASTQAWLAQSLQSLREWKQRQTAMLEALGWNCLDSDANFFCARPPQPLDAAQLRRAGIKLRDASSLGLPGYFRLGVLAPAAQDALQAALVAHLTGASHDGLGDVA